MNRVYSQRAVLLSIAATLETLAAQLRALANNQGEQ